MIKFDCDFTRDEALTFQNYYASFYKWTTGCRCRNITFYNVKVYANSYMPPQIEHFLYCSEIETVIIMNKKTIDFDPKSFFLG